MRAWPAPVSATRSAGLGAHPSSESGRGTSSIESDRPHHLQVTDSDSLAVVLLSSTCAMPAEINVPELLRGRGAHDVETSQIAASGATPTLARRRAACRDAGRVPALSVISRHLTFVGSGRSSVAVGPGQAAGNPRAAAASTDPGPAELAKAAVRRGHKRCNSADGVPVYVGSGDDSVMNSTLSGVIPLTNARNRALTCGAGHSIGGERCTQRNASRRS